MAGSVFDEAEDLGLSALFDLALIEGRTHAAIARQLHASMKLSCRLEGDDAVERFLLLDVAGTLRIGQQAAGSRLADSSRLVQVMVLTLAGLEDGSVLLGQARILLELTRHCSDAVAAEVERRTLSGPDVQELAGWAASRLRSRVAALVLQVQAELEPAGAEERLVDARSRRRVVAGPEPDGMASLWALIPAEGARVFTLGLDELHRRQLIADRAAGTVRTADQRRADLLVLLPGLALHALDGTHPTCTPPSNAGPAGLSDPAGLSAPAGLSDPAGLSTPAGLNAPAGLAGPCEVGAGGHKSVVLSICVPVLSVLGLSEQPGELTGHGPLPASQIRLLLPTAALRRVLVDATTGQPLHIEPALPGPAGDAATARAQLLGMLPEDIIELVEHPEPHYQPSAGLDRFVRLRDQRCTGPGCASSSQHADLDHADPYPTGPTASWNLGPKSRRCHRAKTFSWQVESHAGGEHTWTSPTGRAYRTPSPWTAPPDLPDDRPCPPATTSPARGVPRAGPENDCGLTTNLARSATPAPATPAPATSRPAPANNDDEPPF